MFNRKKLVPLNEAKSHILHFFNESGLAWQTDAFGLLLSWWWLDALYGACFHGVSSSWPNLNSAGPIYSSIENSFPHREEYLEWSPQILQYGGDSASTLTYMCRFKQGNDNETP